MLASWLVVTAVGCGALQKGGRSGTGDGKAPASNAEQAGQGGGTTPGGSVFDRQLLRLAVEFRVHRYTAPKGSFTGESELWKVVTGPLPDAASALRLADNGFRAAIGLESDRNPLSEYLRRVAGLQSAVDDAQPDASRFVELELGACPSRLVVFYYGRTGTLRGLDFQDAQAKLRLWFELRAVNLREVRLELVPTLEEPPGEPKWQMTPEGAKQVPDERRQVFTELAFTAQVPEGGFLVLGATDAVYGQPLLGRPFFIQGPPKDAGEASQERESIYVISPIIRSYDEKSKGRTGEGG